MTSAQDEDQLCPPSAVSDSSPSQLAFLANQSFLPLEAASVQLLRIGIHESTLLLSDQSDLDKLYSGIVPLWRAVDEEITSYDASTKDATRLAETWNNYAHFFNQFLEVTYPDTPENRIKIQSINNIRSYSLAGIDRAIGIISQNLLRDIVAYEKNVALVAAARSDFENTPSSSNNLKRIERATTAAAVDRSNIDYIVPIYEPNNPFENMLSRIKIAYNDIFISARIDDIDRLRQEYIHYGFSTVPPRASMGTLAAPWNTSEYSVGLISSSVQAAANRIIGKTGASISSAFRNPRKEVSPPISGKINSRHCYGDAIDFATGSNKDTFLKIAKAACEEAPTWLEPARMSTINHVHADWRPGAAVISSYCIKPRTPSNITATVLNGKDVNIKWNDSLPSSLDGIKVERSVGDDMHFSQIAVVAHNIQTYNDNNLVPGRYYYRICAYNDLSGNSAFTPVKPAVVPDQGGEAT